MGALGVRAPRGRTPGAHTFRVPSRSVGMSTNSGSDQSPPAQQWEVRHDALVIDGVSIGFVRTIRVTETDLNALPPGFGMFPLRAVDPDDSRLPDAIRLRGGVMLPIYPHEAMWLDFSAEAPVALQVGAGGRCAITGGELTDDLTRDPQNYVVLPEQPWLDGFKTAEGEVRQFVAVTLGSGATVEKQLTGSESVGGLQFQVRGLTPAALERHLSERSHDMMVFSSPFIDALDLDVPLLCSSESTPMGLGAGGRIDQEIYEDRFEADDWEASPLGKVWVHLVAAADWTAFTGEAAPASPISANDYIAAGLPWFDYDNPDGVDVGVTPEMAGLKSVGELTDIEGDLEVVSPDDPKVRVIVGGRDGRVAGGAWTWVGRPS